MPVMPPCVVVMWITLCAFVNVALHSVIIHHYNKKAPVNITLVDLISSDFAFIYSFVIVILAGAQSMIHLGIILPNMVAFCYTWIGYYAGLIMLVYASLGVIFRYLYVYHRRFILEDWPDEQILLILR